MKRKKRKRPLLRSRARLPRDMVPLLLATGPLAGVLVLALWTPVWVTPPHQQYTILLYAALMAAALGGGHLLTRRLPQKSVGVFRLALAVAVLLMACAWCVGPNMPDRMGLFFASFTCDDGVDIGGGRVRYACVYESLEARTDYTLETRKGWPLAVLVKIESQVY